MTYSEVIHTHKGKKKAALHQFLFNFWTCRHLWRNVGEMHKASHTYCQDKSQEITGTNFKRNRHDTWFWNLWNSHWFDFNYDYQHVTKRCRNCKMKQHEWEIKDYDEGVFALYDVIFEVLKFLLNCKAHE